MFAVPFLPTSSEQHSMQVTASSIGLLLLNRNDLVYAEKTYRLAVACSADLNRPPPERSAWQHVAQAAGMAAMTLRTAMQIDVMLAEADAMAAAAGKVDDAPLPAEPAPTIN